MKDLDYLVEDIYAFIEREEEIDPNLIEDFASNLQDAVLQ